MPIHNYVQQPENIATIDINAGAINDDIRNVLEKDFLKAVTQYKGIERIFKGRNELETAKLIWLYLRKHCKYRRDPDHNQLIRLPSYFLNDRSGKPTGDCKTFATLARSAYAYIYPNLETAFKYTAYSPNANKPSHVYATVKDRNGNEITIDGCWRKFNNEKSYTLALTPKYKTMRVTTLSGSSDAAQLLNGINSKANPLTRERIKKLCALRRDMQLAQAEFDGGHINRNEFRARIAEVENGLQGIGKLTPEQKAARKKKLKEGGKKFLWGIAFIHLAPIRGAFTAIVAMNVNSLAHNLRFVYNNRNGSTKEDWKKIEKVWYNVGGLKKALLKAIELGAKHKPLFLSKKAKARFEARKKGTKGYAGCYSLEDDGIGNPAIIAAAIAAASGIIAAMIPAVMQGLKKGGQPQAAQEVAEQGEALVQQQQSGQLQQEAAQGADQQLEEDAPVNDYIGDANTWANLTTALGEVAKVGITAAGTAIANKVKKKPKTKAALEKLGEGADDYFTGRYLRESGYKKTAQDFGSTISNNKLLIGGGIAAALAAFFLLKKK